MKGYEYEYQYKGSCWGWGFIREVVGVHGGG